MKTIKLDIFGWGTELVCGKYSNKDIDEIIELVEGDDEESETFHESLMEECYEIEDVCHENSFEPSTCMLVDEDKKEYLVGDDNTIVSTTELGFHENGVYLLTAAGEKGYFGSIEVELKDDEDFDVKKLVFNVENIGGYHINASIEYNDKEIFVNDEGLSTTGKSIDFQLIKYKDGKTITTYDF